MSRSDVICGVYSIEAPNGACYIGGSTDIYQRWQEHRSMSRRGVHHSPLLGEAMVKYGKDMRFAILEICDASVLRSREQFYFDAVKPTLNAVKDAMNAWNDPAYREKMLAAMQTPEYKKINRATLDAGRAKRFVGIECSDGRSFERMIDAAQAFGVTMPYLFNALKWQSAPKIGVRIKRKGEDWLSETTTSERCWITRRRRNNTIVSAEARAKMSAAKLGKSPARNVVHRAIEENRCPVEAICKVSGEVRAFDSIRQASEWVDESRRGTVAAQISKVCNGHKKSAYGFWWRKAMDAKRDRGEVVL